MFTFGDFDAERKRYRAVIIWDGWARGRRRAQGELKNEFLVTVNCLGANEMLRDMANLAAIINA